MEKKVLEVALYLGAEWVLYLLLGLGALSVLVAVIKWIYFLQQSSPAAELQAALHAFYTGGSRAELEQRLGKMRGVEARVLSAGLEAARSAPDGQQSKGGADAMEDAMVGTLSFERLKFDSGLLIIGTVASNAPFIGLFGTVLGIIKAFHDLSLQSDESASMVMSGISEALVATAVGLLVAIPAVMLYNMLTRRVKAQLGRVESLGLLLVSRVRGGAA